MSKKKDILILGGGHQGLAMAAHLSSCGESVNLWNRTQDRIAHIQNTGKIHFSGIVNGVARINKASSCIDDVLADIIMITTPATAHKEIASMLARKLTSKHIVILNPGRTFGALEFAEIIKSSGNNDMPKIAETQTIVYTCRRDETNNVKIYALKNNVAIAAVNNDDIDDIINAIPICIRDYYMKSDSIIQTSLGNVGMILHCAPVLMNIGWIESPVYEFKYYYDGISKSVASFAEKIDAERINVARALGETVETVSQWMKRSYGIAGDNLYECINNNLYYKDIDAPQTIRHRYLDEDVSYGLVPLENIAKYMNTSVPCTTLVIDLANAVMNIDYRKIGRVISLETIKKYF